MSNNFDILVALWLHREKKRRAQKIIEGAPPLTYTAKNAGTLKNYRIYGQTVDGESVGDRTANLFDGEFLQGYWAYADGVWTKNNTWIATKKIPCKSSTTYTFSFNQTSRWYGFVWFDFSSNYISTNNRQNNLSIQYRSYSAISPPNAAYMAINIAGYPDYNATISLNDIADFMLVENSTALPYEPYGFKIPITNNSETASIYLDEPLRKVGDEADYVDYATQKRHNSDGTESSVTLPTLPTIAGTNTLSVGTQVQPSKVMVRGKISQE